MDQHQIEKGLKTIQARLRSSGVEIKEDYLEIMRSKLKGDITTEQFFQAVREKGKN